jgi:hypothetical protein
MSMSQNKDLTPSELASALAKERWMRVTPGERKKQASKLALIRWSKASEEDRKAAGKRLEKARKKRWPQQKRRNKNGKTR